jgi:hypothetical protein
LAVFGETWSKLRKTWVKLGKSWYVLGWFLTADFADFHGLKDEKDRD